MAKIKKKTNDFITISKAKLKRTLVYGFDSFQLQGISFHYRADIMYERIVAKAEKK